MVDIHREYRQFYNGWSPLFKWQRRRNQEPTKSRSNAEQKTQLVVYDSGMRLRTKRDLTRQEDTPSRSRFELFDRVSIELGYERFSYMISESRP